MRFFYLKLSAFLLAVAIAVLCLLFLFFNHNDRLVQFVPAEAEAYFHAETRDILKLPQNQWQTYTAWLADKSGLPTQAWQSVISELNDAVGIFFINGQAFGLVKNTPRAQALLKQNKINSVSLEKVLLFPSLSPSGNYLTTMPWFKLTHRKIVFADYVVYLKKLNGNIFPFPALGTEGPIAAFGGVNHGLLKLKVRGDVGQTASGKLKPQLTGLPDNFNFYFRNIKTSAMTQKAEYTAENFRFNLLKLIKGPVEYLDTAAGFTIFASMANNPLDELQKNIASLLALTKPTKKAKALPDGTIAIQRIVDPSAWQFKETVEDGQSAWKLTNADEANSISIIQRDKIYSIKHYPKASNQNRSIATDILNNCRKFRNKSSALINLKNISPQSPLNHLYIINQSTNKISICID